MRKKIYSVILEKVVIDDYSCEGFEKSSTPARIIEDE